MEFRIIERTFSQDESLPSFLIANIHPTTDIQDNLNKMEQIIELAHEKGVNILIFPELCISGYIWMTNNNNHVKEHLLNCENSRLTAWLNNIKDSLKSDGSGLEYIFYGNARQVNGDLYNTLFILHNQVDYNREEYLYNKIFVPKEEQRYFRRGSDKRLTIDTKYGRFGFLICYDLCFVELARRYSFTDDADAIITISCWRSEGTREYPEMNIKTDFYYGMLWELMNSSKAAYNQVWSLGANTVGTHEISGVHFWGASGLWAPSGMQLLKASSLKEELLIIRNLDIQKQKYREQDDFNYRIDFENVYREMKEPQKDVKLLF